jgi:hypothetical protein
MDEDVHLEELGGCSKIQIPSIAVHIRGVSGFHGDIIDVLQTFFFVRH